MQAPDRRLTLGQHQALRGAGERGERGGHLAEGKLKAVFDLVQGIRVKAHFAVYPERHVKRPAVEAFLSWLHGEAAKT